MGQKIVKSPEVLIKHYQEQMSACEMSFVENAYEAGKVLIAQKNKLDHGEFSDWCREHWKKSRRTAAEYMLLAENLKPKQVSECVSIRQAKKLLPPNRQRAANLNQELPVNGDISAEIEQEATSGDSPPDPVQNGAVESSVERQPGDESEEGGVDPVAVPDWKKQRAKCLARANELQRDIDDLMAVRSSGNPRRHKSAIKATQEAIKLLEAWA